MKKKLRNIAASVMALVIAFPIVLNATRPSSVSAVDIDSYLYTESDSYNEATEFITLDSEAIEELAELGIDLLGPDDKLANDIIGFAQKYLGRPYSRGSKGPKAFDCSGFTSYIFKEYGISLSPSSQTQYTQGTKINTDEVKPGDLLFFGGRRGGRTVGHVAMAVDVDDDGKITFIHASTTSGICYDTYPDGGYYSSRYIGARRVIE